MVNEAVLRDRLNHPISWDTSTLAIEKGAFLRAYDPRHASGAYLTGQMSGQPCAGIAAREKIASDGRNKVAVFDSGVFDVVASGAITMGAPVEMADNNDVRVASASASGSAVIGEALETAADAETFQMRLKLRS